MKRLITILTITLLISGCVPQVGNEVSCTTSGELLYQPASKSVGHAALSIRNTVQTCINMPDGAIVITRTKE